jgi:hypothetical protein
MILPLRAHGAFLGAKTLASNVPDRRFVPRDLAAAEELARRAALAIDNARLYREAQDAIRLRDEFLSIASHELRTPIAGLKLISEGFATHDAMPSAPEFGKVMSLIARRNREGGGGRPERRRRPDRRQQERRGMEDLGQQVRSWDGDRGRAAVAGGLGHIGDLRLPEGLGVHRSAREAGTSPVPHAAGLAAVSGLPAERLPAPHGLSTRLRATAAAGPAHDRAAADSARDRAAAIAPDDRAAADRPAGSGCADRFTDPVGPALA